MIGERLAEIRKDNGHTQDDLSKLLHVGVGTVRSWEQDRSSPHHDVLVQICKLYHVSSDYLLGLSNIDPVYENRRRAQLFTPEELEELRNFENYLLWRKNNQ